VLIGIYILSSTIILDFNKFLNFVYLPWCTFQIISTKFGNKENKIYNFINIFFNLFESKYIESLIIPFLDNIFIAEKRTGAN
jgi:hypothetical protein